MPQYVSADIIAAPVSVPETAGHSRAAGLMSESALFGSVLPGRYQGLHLHQNRIYIYPGY